MSDQGFDELGDDDFDAVFRQQLHERLDAAEPSALLLARTERAVAGRRRIPPTLVILGAAAAALLALAGILVASNGSGSKKVKVASPSAGRREQAGESG